jgi:hypothetical protein
MSIICKKKPIVNIPLGPSLPALKGKWRDTSMVGFIPSPIPVKPVPGRPRQFPVSSQIRSTMFNICTVIMPLKGSPNGHGNDDFVYSDVGFGSLEALAKRYRRLLAALGLKFRENALPAITWDVELLRKVLAVGSCTFQSSNWGGILFNFNHFISCLDLLSLFPRHRYYTYICMAENEKQRQ